MNPLVSFAEAVLGILAADKDWGGDTLDSISSTAHALGLATTGEDGRFSIAPATLPHRPRVPSASADTPRFQAREPDLTQNK